MGERAQLLGRGAAHQALMRAWNTCVSKSGAASLQFGRQVPAGHWKPPFQHAVGLSSLSLLGFQWHLIFEDQTAMSLAGELCFDSGLVLAFGRSWRRYRRPSLASWLTDGGLRFTAPVLSCSPWRPHQGAAQGYVCCQRAPVTWPNTPVGWRAEPGLGIFPGSQPKAGLMATDINRKFNMHPSCRCSANSPSPAVHQSLCKGGWWPSCHRKGGTSPLQHVSAPQFALLVCALGEQVRGRIIQGPGQMLPGSKQVLNFFTVKLSLFFFSVHFLAQFRCSLIPVTTEMFCII